MIHPRARTTASNHARACPNRAETTETVTTAMEDDAEIKFLRRPVDTLRLGLGAAREVGSSTTKHPVEVMQEEVRARDRRRGAERWERRRVKTRARSDAFVRETDATSARVFATHSTRAGESTEES